MPVVPRVASAWPSKPDAGFLPESRNACFMRATFGPAARLHRPSEFAAALKGRRIARGALLVVSTPREQPEADASARLGMIIAKRFAPHAVTRNTIKRVIRESFRQRRDDLPPRDFVFRLHGPVGSVTLTELKKQVRAEVETLLDKVQAS